MRDITSAEVGIGTEVEWQPDGAVGDSGAGSVEPGADAGVDPPVPDHGEAGRGTRGSFPHRADGERDSFSGPSAAALQWSTYHSRLRRRAWRFARAYSGDCLTRNGGLGENPAGIQCVNLANEWLRLNGCPGIHGNADAFVGETSGHFEWEELPSGGRPRVGDILVWGISPGMPEGHVAVCLDGSVDPVAVLEENYPTGSCVGVGHHDRASYVGVIRPHG